MDGQKICGLVGNYLANTLKNSYYHFVCDTQHYKILQSIVSLVNTSCSNVAIISPSLSFSLAQIISSRFNCNVDILTNHPVNMLCSKYYNDIQCNIVQFNPVFDKVNDRYDLVVINDYQFLSHPQFSRHCNNGTKILAICSATDRHEDHRYKVYQPSDVFEFEDDLNLSTIFGHNQQYYNHYPIMSVFGVK